MLQTPLKDIPGRDMLVRPMQRHDLPIVAAMMARLVHERRDAEPMDAAILQSLLFDSAPALLGLAAERFGCTVGYALARRDRNDLILDQIAVMEGSRGRGLGRMLVLHMRDVRDDSGCARLLAAPGSAGIHGAGFYDAIGLNVAEALKMPA